MKRPAHKKFKKFLRLQQSFIIVALLCSLVFAFYFYAGTGLESFLWKFVLLTLLTDFLYTALHIFRKPIKHRRLRFDPSKLTIVIACYNGEDVIGDTIESAMVHVPTHQIIVVSDASTDATASVARSYGTRVYINDRNMNKALSISNVMKHVTTPYVLILDDDTLIGKAFIPTSLLDRGYAAVAFNVMPLQGSGLLNKLQRFEYRKSMFFGKNLRARAGAIGNISGAIGLFKTADLMQQVPLHSGQYGGEDQQRTAFVHLYGKGKGVTYTDTLVETKVPPTLKSFFKQRAFRWNRAVPELFMVYWKILLNPKHHYLLKVDKAYQIFWYTTDPLRAVLMWAALLYPASLLSLYAIYLFLSIAKWIKMGHQDAFWIVLVFPVYHQLQTFCRFIANLYWLKVKVDYMFRHKLHRLVDGRSLAVEYTFVAVFITLIWTVASTTAIRLSDPFAAGF